MHPSVLDFVKRVLTAEQVKGADVLEVGSYDVNGSVRPYVESLDPSSYLGVDAQSGPGVDRVVDCEQLTGSVQWSSWNIVISTEMLEHVGNWRNCMYQMVDAMTTPGLLLITTRSPGFGFHPFPEDHWRFTVDEMTVILEAIGLEVLTIQDDPGIGSPGVFALARKPIDWVVPSGVVEKWDQLAIPEGRFDV